MMNKRKSTKQALTTSALSLILCILMLLGTTFAWFTDSINSVGNIITAGNLDIEMYWTDDLSSDTWYNVEDADRNTIFDYENWEPGYTDVKYIKLVNNGNLALNYKLTLTPQNGVGKLAEVINVYYANTKEGVEVASRDDLDKLSAVGLLNNIMNGGETVDGTLLAAHQESPIHDSGETIVTVAMSMLTSAGNEYQGESSGDFTVTALASQAPFESDSFGFDYDIDAPLPGILYSDKATVAVTPDDGKVPAGGATLQGEKVKAFVPAGAQMAQGADKLTLSVTPLEKTTSDITVVNNEILIPVDVHIDGIDKNNTTPIIIDLGEILPKYLNMGNYHLFHVEDGQNKVMTIVDSREELTAHNRFTYDPTTGEVSVAMATFSEVTIVADTTSPWKGNEDYSWYNEEAIAAKSFKIANADQLYAFSKIVGGMAQGYERDSFNGKSVALLSDINLNHGTVVYGGIKTIFYPVGYYNTDDGIYEDKDNYDDKTGVAITSGFKTFEGTFDGNGHTISNIYQNTWEMKGDHDWYDPKDQHYRDGMGIFGRVYGGTIKNLTVDNFESDGEITTTGVIASYADFGATFENIAITNCNPRVYNIGNGGIVGCVGWYTKDETTDKVVTFKNITVDVTNKISALWGSYDVACGGIVGQYYPTSGQTSAGSPKNAGIHFENCHVAAIMDVYNDVCANYQYYAYRYAGMIIGSIRENETIGGHLYPKMDGITASGCTVHYDTWNDYYYCELVANSLASYTHDHQFSRLTQVEAVDAQNMMITSLKKIKSEIPTEGRYNYVVVNGDHGTKNAECYHFVNGKQHFHNVADDDNKEIYETVNGAETLKEDHAHIYLPFAQLFTGYGWGVTSKGISDFEGIEIQETDKKDSAVKFQTKFTGDFLYRVGNEGPVALGTLFKAAEGQTINNESVHVTFNKLDDNMNVSATYNANTTDWTKGTITFNGTGVIKVTIQDYIYCTPTVLYLEVVDAVNTTGATNATSRNVVLLNDCGFNSLEVSGGYALYGNGFTMTCSSDSPVLDTGYSFVTLNNGTLDNVQIVCPNFDYAALYKSNLEDSGNRWETTDRTRYYNAKSGVTASGNSQILNSRISGGRASLNVSGGNVVVDNSHIELGAVASILVGSANSLTLRDVTLVQKPTVSTHDSSKTLMGFSVLFVCDADGNATPTTIEGSFIQQAWIDESDKKYVPSAGQSIVSTVLTKTEYLHDIDGDGTNESLNLGFAYMPESITSKVNAATITDNRTNKDTVPYDYAEVAILNGKTYVYSYKNTKGTADSFKEENTYKPNTQSDIITVTYSDTADGLSTGKSYSTDGWMYELNVDLDKLSGYALDFSKMSMSVNGVTVTDFKVNGSAKPTSAVAVIAGGTTYKLTATVNGKEYVAYYKVTGTETSKESPKLVTSNYEAGICVASKKGGTWHGAAPALEGIQIRYWSVAEKQYKTITLADEVIFGKGKLNGVNTTWTYSPANGDFTLTLTGGQVHSGNKVNAMPVGVDTDNDNDGTADTLYFVAASSNGLVNSGNSARTIPVTYSFKDNNSGDELTFSHTWSVAEQQDAEYGYDDFCNGTLTKLESSSSSGGCVTPDTLITLADGTRKRVDEIKGDELLLVWNLKTGKYEAAPIVFVDSEAEAEYEITHLYFSDGSDVKVIYEHGFFDLDLGKYVYIDAINYADYIGHRFVKQGDIESNAWDIITLDKVVIEQEKTTAWSPVTFEHLCYYTNGVLSMPGGIEGLFNIFEVNTDAMRYDAQQMERDIAQYGLFALEDFGGMITQDAFDAFNGAYLKVAMGKDLLTWEDIAYMAKRYIPLM